MVLYPQNPFRDFLAVKLKEVCNHRHFEFGAIDIKSACSLTITGSRECFYTRPLANKSPCASFNALSLKL